MEINIYLMALITGLFTMRRHCGN